MAAVRVLHRAREVERVTAVVGEETASRSKHIGVSRFVFMYYMCRRAGVASLRPIDRGDSREGGELARRTLATSRSPAAMRRRA